MSSLEYKIRKLERCIQDQEKYITYLENQITSRDEELETLKVDMVNLKNRFKKILQDIDSRDKTLIAYENQLIELTNDLSSLQHRIQQFHQSVIMASSSTTAISKKNIYTLLKAVRDNFKYLANCYKGNDTLLNDEL